MSMKGSCLCGSVKVTLAQKFDEQILCHCTDCKQTSGAPFSSNVLAKKSDVTIEGNTSTFGVKAPSGNTVERVFCPKCGSAIGHNSVAFGDARAIQTGNFPDFAKIPVGTELFVKDRWTGIPATSGKQVQTM